MLAQNPKLKLCHLRSQETGDTDEHHGCLGIFPSSSKSDAGRESGPSGLMETAKSIAASAHKFRLVELPDRFMHKRTSRFSNSATP